MAGFTRFADVAVLEPRVFTDERGFFFESFTQQRFEAETGSTDVFVQDNHSRSGRGVIRGLHYQLPPHAQGKLVRCVRGQIFDVAVDIRKSSVTFGRWFGLVLSEDNKRQLWIPPGFAHGFFSLSDPADLLYKTTDYYTPELERSIRWDDPTIGIDWPDVGVPAILAGKDADAPLLQDADVFD